MNLLDSDEDDSTVKEKKVSTQLRRTRRASASCTTPTRMTISTVTPTRVKNTKKPKSEIKKIRANVSSDEEDFQPSNKSFSKLKPKSFKVKAKSTWSSSGVDTEPESDIPVKKAATQKTPKRVFKKSDLKNLR